MRFVLNIIYKIYLYFNTSFVDRFDNYIEPHYIITTKKRFFDFYNVYIIHSVVLCCSSGENGLNKIDSIYKIESHNQYTNTKYYQL